MSHFTVLVIGPEVEKQLQPFHEYECTGIEDEYVTFVETETSQQELEAEFEENKDSYSTMEEFMKDYHGYEQNEEGKWGRLTNPNAQWDWWLVGGRWTGFFKLKPGAHGDIGEPGLMTPFAKSGTADSVLKKDIDFDGMRNEEEESAAKKFDMVFEAIKDTPVSETWDVIRETYKDDISVARTKYHEQERVMAFKELTGKHHDMFGFHDSVEDYNISREEYLQNARNSAISTFAVVKDSTWYEKGSMGWWGMSTDEMEQSEWNKKFNELIDSVPDDTLFTLVDCHI